jgi:hypothetical protein
LSGGDHRWFNRSTRKKKPVTRDIHIIIIITIIIIIIISTIIINCKWVITRWQWLFYMYTDKKKVTRTFKSGGLHERHVVATWKLGNHLSIRL